MKVVDGREPSWVDAASSGSPLLLTPEIAPFIWYLCLSPLLDRDGVFCTSILMPMQGVKCIMVINVCFEMNELTWAEMG